MEAFQSSQLPEHLVSMVSILVEEEATLGDTGPCVEFFLQQKILETLCLLAERDVCVKIYIHPNESMFTHMLIIICSVTNWCEETRVADCCNSSW